MPKAKYRPGTLVEMGEKKYGKVEAVITFEDATHSYMVEGSQVGESVITGAYRKIATKTKAPKTAKPRAAKPKTQESQANA